MLRNEKLLGKTGFDTEENEPSKLLHVYFPTPNVPFHSSFPQPAASAAREKAPPIASMACFSAVARKGSGRPGARNAYAKSAFAAKMHFLRKNAHFALTP